MSNIDVIAYALSAKYTDDSLEGGGSVKGANCQIKSITDIAGGKRVTFLWKNESNVEQTSVMDVMNGSKGDDGDQGEDGVGIASFKVEGTNLIVVLTDGTESDPIEIPTVNGTDGKDGTDGVSPTVTTATITGGTKVIITDVTGSHEFDVMDGQNGQDGLGVPAGGTTGQILAKKSDSNNDTEWVDPSGGDSELESAVTSNLTVGALPSGSTLPKGTTFTEFAQKLLVTEIAPTLSFSISKSGNQVYGGSYTETLTVSCTAMGTAKKIKSIAWYEGNTLKQTDTIDSSTTGSWTYTMDTATTDSTTFKAVITYTKSDDSDTSVTKTASINFYYNKFYGAVSDLSPSEATVEALTTALGTAKGGTYSFTVSAGRICYAYPKSLGALSSIKDGNGFSLFDSFTRTEVSYTQNGTTVAYYRYVLTDATSVTNYSVVFA